MTAVPLTYLSDDRILMKWNAGSFLSSRAAILLLPITGFLIVSRGDPFEYRRLHGDPRDIENHDPAPGQGGKEIVSDLIDRQALHAFSLTLEHPVSKETLHLEAPLPNDMLDVIKQLKR